MTDQEKLHTLLTKFGLRELETPDLTRSGGILGRKRDLIAKKKEFSLCVLPPNEHHDPRTILTLTQSPEAMYMATDSASVSFHFDENGKFIKHHMCS